MLIGIAFTIVLAVLYAVPVARLMPYAAVERLAAPSAPAKEGWDVSLDAIGRTLKLRARRPRAGEPKPLRDRMVKDLGADRAKLRTIMDGSVRGAGVQGLATDTFTAHIVRVVTLILPALTGALLSFIG